ncbi:MAG: LapA family protein [Silicimonas sp.]|nr:LapA family protein [Silicimonas sp.]
MRFIRLLVLAAIAIALVTVAMANRDPLTVRLLPDELAALVGLNWEITLPVFMVMLAAMVVGVALGFVWEWLREHKHRATAASEGKERRRLEQEVRKAAPSSEKGDDVLALLERKSA